jgi:hypothetical protein
MSFPVIRFKRKREFVEQDAELVICDIKNKLGGSIEGFRFLTSRQIRDLIKNNYNLDDDVLTVVIFRLLIEYLDDNTEFMSYKEKKDRITINDLRGKE